MANAFAPVCPNCRKNAPIVYRGILAYCTACNAPRPPLVAPATNLAGKGSMVGGTITRVLGWIVLASGSVVGLGLLGILQALFPAGFAGWLVGIPILIITLIISIALVRGGRSLETSGVTEQRATRTQAIFSLAENRGGIVTAADVAGALGMPTTQADTLLTELAKSQSDYVTVEVDDQGALYYRVSARGLSRIQSFDERLRRTASGGSVDEKLRVATAEPRNPVEEPTAQSAAVGRQRG